MEHPTGVRVRGDAAGDRSKHVQDTNAVGHVGEHVFYHSPAVRPRAALIANVDNAGGPVDLVVFCQGRSFEARERWASGFGVVGFRGLIEHASVARERKLANWWSHVREDCEDGLDIGSSPS